MSDMDDLKYNFGCASCGYKQVDENRPLGRIPIERVIEKLDDCFSKNDMAEAGRLLEYWQGEAQSLGDRQGELTVVNEMLGYYRKVQDKTRGLAAVTRADELISTLGIVDALSSATVYLNIGTTLKAFGRAEDGLPYYKKCFSIYENNLDDNDPRFAGFYNNYGLCQQDLGMYEDARMSFLYAASIMLLNNDGNGDAAISYVNLAHCLEDWGGEHADEARDYIKVAYKLLSDDELKRDGQLAYTLSKCWPSFEHFGFEKEAAELRSESERIYGMK